MLELVSLILNAISLPVIIILIYKLMSISKTISNMAVKQELILGRLLKLDDNIGLHLSNDLKDIAFGAHASVQEESSFELDDRFKSSTVSSSIQPLSGDFQPISSEEIGAAKKRQSVSASDSSTSDVFGDG